MTRKLTTAAAALGAALTLVMGSGLIAITSDSVRSNDNRVESGTFALPAHDIKAAQTNSFAACNNATYEDGPISVLITTDGPNFELDGTGTTPIFVCLRNAGTQAGRLRMSFENVADTEVGSCQPSESDASGGADTTCEDGDQGELKGHLFVQIVATNDGGCFSQTPGFISIETTPGTLSDSLGSGDTCRLRMAIVRDPNATDSQKLAAQTDRVQWDMVFTLEDVPA